MGANLITPEYEYQEKHHLFFGKPEEERRTNRGECAYPYACDICQPAHRVYNGLPHRRSQMGHRQTTCKAGLHQQAETERIRNQYRPAALLYGNTEHLQGVRGSGNHAYHRTSKGGFQQPAQRKEGGRTAETPDVRPYGGIRGVHQGMRDTERLV